MLPTVMWTETPEVYTMVTEPYVNKVLSNEFSLSWLYNVLSKEKEADRVLYEDDDEVQSCTSRARLRDVRVTL